MRNKKGNSQSDNNIISAELRETFNKIKVNLDFTTIDNPNKVIIISSSLMAEGKTSIAINTAISMANAGSRTLLIDADMRQPRVHKLFSVLNLHGLSDIIADSENWHTYVNNVGVDNLQVITSGRKPPNPAELLGSQHMSVLIDKFKSEYDYIVFDSPPILPVPDALSLAKYTNGIILVTRYGFSNVKALQQCRDALKLANAKVIGAIVNDMPVSTYGYGRYGYGKYGYGYGYGKEEQGSSKGDDRQKNVMGSRRRDITRG